MNDRQWAYVDIDRKNPYVGFVHSDMPEYYFIEVVYSSPHASVKKGDVRTVSTHYLQSYEIDPIQVQARIGRLPSNIRSLLLFTDKPQWTQQPEEGEDESQVAQAQAAVNSTPNVDMPTVPKAYYGLQ